jgi:hypothetical protein
MKLIRAVPVAALAACLAALSTTTASAVIAPEGGSSSAGSPAAAQSPAAGNDSVEVFAPDGTIDRVRPAKPAQDGAPSPSTPKSSPGQAVPKAEVIPIEVNGPSASRFDLVFVGDGYTKSQIATYTKNVKSSIDVLFAREPFKAYRKQFNIYQVNVVSNVSGVSDDPRGTKRSTPLGMYFYCGGLDRLLCVNQKAAKDYAANAPAADQIVALANTKTYGGAGGGVATAAGGSTAASEIVIHELGHSIGLLADEYDYGKTEGCGSFEPPSSNVSIYQEAELRRRNAKWAKWLGKTSPDGGKVSTFEGAYYCKTGVYRPTENSIMRTLSQEFNLPGRESMTAAILDKGGMIDGGSTGLSAGKLSVKIAPLPSAPRILWTADGRIVQRSGASLDVAALRLGAGSHRIRCIVSDGSDRILDRALRNRSASTKTWTVQG